MQCQNAKTQANLKTFSQKIYAFSIIRDSVFKKNQCSGQDASFYVSADSIKEILDGFYSIRLGELA